MEVIFQGKYPVLLRSTARVMLDGPLMALEVFCKVESYLDVFLPCTNIRHTDTLTYSQRTATSHTVWLFWDGYMRSSNFMENQARINMITEHSPEGWSSSSGGFYANSTHNPMLIYFIKFKQRLLFDPRDLPFLLWVPTVSSNPFSRRVCQEYKWIKQD